MPFDSRIVIRDATLDDADALTTLSGQLGYTTLYLAAGLNITALVVDANHQQLGIGRRLLDHAADYARHQQLAFLRVNSGAHREDDHSFYRRVGFQHEKDQKHLMRWLNPRAE